MIDYLMGTGPELLEGPGTQSAGNLNLVEIYQSPLLDLTKTYSGIELVPGKPGLIPYPIDIQGPGTWLLEQKAGAQTSPPTTQAGSDAAHQNFLKSSNTNPTNALFNTAVAPCILNGPSTGALSGTLKRLPGMPIYFDVTVPAAGTGGYICLARLYVAVGWVAVIV